VALDEPPYFLACMGSVAIVSGHLVVPPALAQSLNIGAGSDVGFLPR
jgi:hypothetical protein